MPKEKDITEKTLESHPDVFADIVNGLLFDGREVIRETELEDASPVSQLKLDGALHEQERDAAKYWKHDEIRIALCGLENQTKPDRDMVLRILGYDGAAYKEQVNLHVGEHRAGKVPSPVYPALTLVLYFGDTPWTAPRTLRECFGQMPDALMPYVQDYRIHVFEIAFLTPEQINRFRSDFRLVADFLVQKRTKKEYTPPEDTIRHVDEVLKLLSAVTGDRSYEEVRNALEERDKEGTTMCDVVNSFVEKGRREGRREGERIVIDILREMQSGKTDEQIFKNHPNASLDLVQTLRQTLPYPY